MNAQEILQQNNPFITNAASNPWSQQTPSVDSLNKVALNGLLALIREKNHSPETPISAAVFGDAGMGKTHLIQRLKSELAKHDLRASFVSVKDIINPKEPMRRLLLEIVEDLDKKIEFTSQYTQLHYLLADLLYERVTEHFQKHPKQLSGPDRKGNRQWLEEMESDRLSAIKMFGANSGNDVQLQQCLLQWFRIHEPSVDQKFLQVLFHYSSPDPNVREIATSWLRGNTLDKESYAILGVTPRSSAKTGVEDTAAIEDECRRYLVSLGRLLQYTHRSLVVCFDQLDSLREPERIDAFGDMIHILVNSVSAMLPVSFVQLANWRNKFVNTIAPAVRDRVEMNEFRLPGCTVEEAKQIINTRIVSQFGAEKAKPLSKWLLDRVKITPGDTPRIVIKEANRIITNVSEDKLLLPEEKLQEMVSSYEQERRLIETEFSTLLPDKDKLDAAMKLFLDSRGFKYLDSPDPKYITTYGVWKNNTKGIPCAFMITTTRNAASVGAALKRGLVLLNENQTKGKKTAGASKQKHCVCFFITDQRSQILDHRCLMFPATWKAANKLLLEFNEKGGEVCILSAEQVARWFALYSLRNKILEGDITIGNRTATEKDLNSFIKNGLPQPLLELPNELTAEASPNKDVIPTVSGPVLQNINDIAEELNKAIEQILKKSQITSAKLLERLKQKEFPLDLTMLHK
ncbi:MAG: ATP-binding protein, partial [Thermoguttaceae bacterium]